MIGLDICSWSNDSSHFCALYNFELLLALTSFFITLFIFMYSFSGDRFNPHTAIMRAFIFGDLVANFAYILEALTSLLPKDPQLKQHIGSPDVSTISVSSCVIYRPYLFLLSMSRQWIAILALVMGLERFLFICYPLWFKVVRVRRLPIIMFTTCFVCLSSSIGYTNALVVAPNEEIHFQCESTWAFGEHYGWAQSSVIIFGLITAWFLNFYSYTIAAEERALMRFGNNRTRMTSERRKIRKAMWMLTSLLLCCAVPQLITVILRLLSRDELQNWKLIANQLYMFKTLANIIMVKKLGRGSSIWKVSSRFWCCFCKPVRRPRHVVDNCESIASISKYVH